MFEANLINTVLIWDHIQNIEDQKRIDPFGDFPCGVQPIDLDGIPSISQLFVQTAAPQEDCSCCTEHTQGIQPV